MSRNVTIGSTRTAVALTFAAAVFLSAAWLTLPGCGGGAGPGSIAAAVGSYGDVAVLVSNPAYGRTFPDILERVLPRERFVLHEEPVYRTSFFSGKEWRKGRNFRNLLLLVRWGDGGPVQDLAARLVSADTRRRLLAAGGGVVTRHDPLFKRQLAVVVLAPTAKRLREVVEQQGAALADTLARDIRRRIVADHRDQGLLTASMAKAARECGFTLEIPATWRENQFRPDGYPGVEWLWLDGATRGITVAWRPLPDPAAALDDTATLRDLRRDLGHTLHHEELVPSSLRWGRERVAERPAVRLAGDWRSNRVSVGGPFRSYFVVDPDQGRLYCLDLLVYAPNREKMDDFRRLRAILETFRTGDDRAP